MTMRSMEHAIARIGSEMALSKGELQEIMAFADADGDGAWAPRPSAPRCSAAPARPLAALASPTRAPAPTLGAGAGAGAGGASLGAQGPEESEGEGALGGLAVAEASLYPPETQAGVWPTDYTLSDHAVLTAVFTTIGMVMGRVEGC